MLYVSKTKSSIYIAKMNDMACRRILEIIDFQEGTMSDYHPLMDYLIRHINFLPQKTLSYAKNTQPITLALQGVECF